MVVAIDNLSFAYGKEPVIENLSFTIKPGETVVVLGPDGTETPPQVQGWRTATVDCICLPQRREENQRR
ncbi:ABC-type dipeptide/oligopeptide/nickel transport system ATPase subunit [Trueperella bonasi]|uniref:ABC-type dipeptide/oligopeptide/nickel transport system ATPase subunit n=1 Tax=Trueperella bonasi TaxID=312286 RepID=A0ABT9NEV9_9ACTO|nr:hypothetical protein [Trueperella bonasi]MDP9805928.1 ABC-type dipeptide/oligopeptide/nickel transport system ATPase subunit [Trueperella bonasi]